MRILLIEDDEVVADMISYELKAAGHLVVWAGNGEDGMALAISETLDILIMDRQLPGEVDGADLAKALRKRGLAVPVLFLSGMGGLQDWIRGLDAGGDDYIVKPFRFDDLLARLESLHHRHVQAIRAGSEV